ncbi:MAG: enoyl-CoA hydratase [Nevskiaceae bacterium]|nr:MAG: enoyl-CoA hydratase [Nevskiaceae bacterium]TBR71758.1 MAG: enoyl-CoA hydratase [Nevskiaceae bacterium]
MTDTDDIQTRLEDGVLILRLNRPTKKNAVTLPMYSKLGDALLDAAHNTAVRVVVLTGHENGFSSGNDLADFTPDHILNNDDPVIRYMYALATLEKPIIAAVNGLAIGIGATTLLNCDLVYAGHGTRFQFPFVNLGICPEFASTFLLPRIMGHARAAELTFFGDVFSAEKAHEYGLINAVLEPGEVEAHALERAHTLARKPPAAMRVTKQLMKRWTNADVREAIRVEAEHFMPMFGSEEVREAVTAFQEKRKPDFSHFWK